MAAAAALKLASLGKRVLLAEVGEKSFFQYVFDQSTGHQPQLLRENLWICRWEGEECLKEYISHLLKVEKIVSLFFSNPVMKALVQAAPALKELALVGKFTSGRRGIGPEMPYDFVVVDAYSTGHFKALLQAPRGMAEAIPFGPMGEQCRSMDQVLHDPEACKIWVVSLPEELPVTETLEHIEFLTSEMNLKPDVVLNRVWETPLEPADCENLPPSSNEDFLNFVCAELQEQQAARSELKGKVVFELPYQMQALSPTLLQELSERTPAPWSLS